jgi:hypothetical protein
VFSHPSAGLLAHLGQIECGDEPPIAPLSFPGGAQVPPARARAHVPIINLAIKSYRGRTPLAGWRKIANYSPRIRGARAQSIAKAAVAAGVSGCFLSACPWQTPSILPPNLIATLDLHLPRPPPPPPTRWAGGKGLRQWLLGPPPLLNPGGLSFIENVYPTTFRQLAGLAALGLGGLSNNAGGLNPAGRNLSI